MSEPFIAEVKIFSFNFAPRGWAFCDGQIMPISQNQALYSLVGTTYGGNGQTTFALPDLRGRSPVHTNPMTGITLGQRAGEESHTLTPDEMPMHTHTAVADSNTATTQKSPVGSVWATETVNAYGTTVTGAMNATAVTSAGGSQPHENMQPYLALNFCIALQGIYPTRS